MAGSERARAKAGPDGRRLRVLVAEDNELNRVLAARMLQNCGYEPVLVTTGSEALSEWELGQIDLILMDLQMPQMDGFEATLAIREREKSMSAHTPIIAFTANASSADEARCRAVGMDGFIAKPVSVDVFCDAIASVLERGAMQSAPAAVVQVDDAQVFDLSQALEAVEGDRELLNGMIGIFMRQTPRVLEDMDAGIAAGDAAAIEIAAHKLKGSVAMFGAKRAREAAQSLEDIAEARDLAAVPAARATLGEAIARLTDSLQAAAGEGQ